MTIELGSVYKLTEGHNSYTVSGFDGDYVKFVCTDYVQNESVLHDINIFGQEYEFWIHKDEMYNFVKVN